MTSVSHAGALIRALRGRSDGVGRATSPRPARSPCSTAALSLSLAFAGPGPRVVVVGWEPSQTPTFPPTPKSCPPFRATSMFPPPGHGHGPPRTQGAPTAPFVGCVGELHPEWNPLLILRDVDLVPLPPPPKRPSASPGREELFVPEGPFFFFFANFGPSRDWPGGFRNTAAPLPHPPPFCHPPLCSFGRNPCSQRLGSEKYAWCSCACALELLERRAQRGGGGRSGGGVHICCCCPASALWKPRWTFGLNEGPDS